MHYYADEHGVYIGGFVEPQNHPANIIEVPFPPDFAGTDAFGQPIQLWNVAENKWLPERNPNPDIYGFITDLCYDVAGGGSPPEMLWFVFAFYYQGTAQNVDVDMLRKVAFQRIAANPRFSEWFTPEYQQRLIAMGAARNMPFV